MPDLSGAFVQWLLEQLDSLPTNLLRDGAELLTADRLLAHVFEERETSHMRALLRAPEGRDPNIATILLPGLLGSLLASTRGLSAVLWFNPMIIMDGHINLLDLAPDGRSDSSPDVDIVPVGIEKVTYLDLIRTLAAHSRLYQFPYDWRRHIEHNADLLANCVRRWNAAEPERRYTFVCHSMGGMVARTYLARHPQEAERMIERVIMLGTPYHGAPAVTMTFVDEQHPGHLMYRLNEDNDMRGLCANMPSLYHLLPAPPELFCPERAYPFDWDIYDASAWGMSWIRQDYLDDARALHHTLHAADPQVEIVSIAGCHRRTIEEVRLGPDADGCPLVAVYGAEDANLGDGQVPAWSAQDDGLRVYYVDESHSRLVSNEHILENIVNLLHGDPVTLSETVPAQAPTLRGLRSTPLMQQVAEIREHIEQGKLTRRDIEKFFFSR
jgi:pimeloyl-ACP methyl ester carboxylesterase